MQAPETSNHLGNLSLAAVTAGFLALKLVVPVWHPVWHEACLRFFEAGMVGGLADWFAVTALFRHPLGLRFIPHTNLLLKNRAQIEASIGNLVRHLLSPAQLREALERTSLGAFFQNVLRDAGFRAYLRDKVRDVAVIVARQVAAGRLRRDLITDLQAYLETEVNYAEHLGDLLHDAHQRGMIDDIAEYAAEQLAEAVDRHADTIVDYVYRKIDPDFLMQFFVNKDRLKEGLPKLRGELVAIGGDAAHPVRAYLRDVVMNYGVFLRGHPETQAHVKAWVLEFLGNVRLVERLEGFSDHATEALVRDLEQRDGRFVAAVDEGVEHFVQALDNAETRASFDKQVKAVVFALMDEQLVGKLADVAQAAMRKMDDREFVRFVEGKVADDLQYIRLNGAIVGGLVGLALYGITLVSR